MAGKHCRLYDENLVHNIMISTGLSIMEYLKENSGAKSDEICEFIEINATSIIEDTIEQLNASEEYSDKESKFGDLDSEEQYPFGEEQEEL